MLDYRQLGDILAWGMVDKFSWLWDRSRDDKLRRGCPYDPRYRPSFCGRQSRKAWRLLTLPEIAREGAMKGAAARSSDGASQLSAQVRSCRER